MKINKFKSLLTGSMLVATMISCDNDSTPPYLPLIDDHVGRKYFNVVVSTSTEDNTETYVQSFEDVSLGEVSVVGNGYEVPSTRTARLYASNSGAKLYSLDYGGGTISNFDVLGGQNYIKISDLTFTSFMGTEYARWTKIDNNNALMHYVKAGKEDDLVADNAGNYLYHKAATTLLNVDLINFKFSLNAENKATTFEIPRTDYDDQNKIYVSRIDAPAVVGGKAYYGLSKTKYDPATGESVKGFVNYPATSLVVDYPSLTNPKLISSTIATGQNYGYRIPVAHVHGGSVYQLSSEPAHILKLTNGAYDNTYIFDLAATLGVNTGIGARGWFYTGDGIGYVLYYDSAKGSSEAAKAWGVARVDIINKTAIKMNVPAELYLFQYQYAVIGNDGKLYMALAPVGKEGNIYIFDPTNTSADGFTVGAKLKTGAGISYVGIF